MVSSVPHALRVAHSSILLLTDNVVCVVDLFVLVIYSIVLCLMILI